MEREDILYDHIYPRLSDDQTAKAVFLECLDDYIANNVLVNLPPAIVQDFFTYLEREGLYGAIEASVVRLPVTCLDLHQVWFVPDRLRLGYNNGVPFFRS